MAGGLGLEKPRTDGRWIDVPVQKHDMPIMRRNALYPASRHLQEETVEVVLQVTILHIFRYGNESNKCT